MSNIKNPFKVGDYAQAINGRYSSNTTVGKLYKVTGLRTNSIEYIDNNGRNISWHFKYFRFAPWIDSPLWKAINE